MWSLNKIRKRGHVRVCGWSCSLHVGALDAHLDGPRLAPRSTRPKVRCGKNHMTFQQETIEFVFLNWTNWPNWNPIQMLYDVVILFWPSWHTQTILLLAARSRKTSNSNDSDLLLAFSNPLGFRETVLPGGDYLIPSIQSPLWQTLNVSEPTRQSHLFFESLRLTQPFFWELWIKRSASKFRRKDVTLHWCSILQMVKLMNTL